MPDADARKYCPLLCREIRRAYCFEINEVLDDNMDMEHIEDLLDVEKAEIICQECGWRTTPIT